MLVRGYTVQNLQKRLDRLNSVDYKLHLLMEKIHDYVGSRYEKHSEAVKQAIADRYAAIRNAQDEILDLEKLSL